MNGSPARVAGESGLRHDAPWTWTDEGVVTGARRRRRRMVGVSAHAQPRLLTPTDRGGADGRRPFGVDARDEGDRCTARPLRRGGPRWGPRRAVDRDSAQA